MDLGSLPSGATADAWDVVAVLGAYGLIVADAWRHPEDGRLRAISLCAGAVAIAGFFLWIPLLITGSVVTATGLLVSGQRRAWREKDRAKRRRHGL